MQTWEHGRTWLGGMWERLITVSVPDEESARLGRLFNTLMVINVGIGIAIALSLVWVQALGITGFPLWVAALFPVSLGLLSVLCIALAKRGHIRSMITLYIWANFAGTTLSILLLAGIYSPGWALYIWTIILAGTLLAPGYALVMTAIVCGFYLLLLLLTRLGVFQAFLVPGEESALLVVAFALIVLVFAGGFLTYLNMRSLRNVLDELRTAKQELEQRIATEKEQREQLQRLMRSEREQREHLQETAARLQLILTQTREAANSLSSGAAEILASTTKQVSGTSRQSAAILQGTAAIDEVRAIAEQTARHARSVATLVRQTVEASQMGRQAAADTVQGMEQVKDKMELVASNIQTLSDQTQEVGQIIASVTEVAAQSNLLALNAAVEAARAGEAGRGFAVVAQEVRALAEQSRAATMEVKGILFEIQGGVHAAAVAAAQGVKGTDLGMRLASETGWTIQGLAEQVTKASQAAVQIAAAAEQQLAQMEQIGLAMDDIRQVASQSVADARQVEQAAGEFNGLAEQLRALVEQHQL